MPPARQPVKDLTLRLGREHAFESVLRARASEGSDSGGISALLESLSKELGVQDVAKSIITRVEAQNVVEDSSTLCARSPRRRHESPKETPDLCQVCCHGLNLGTAAAKLIHCEDCEHAFHAACIRPTSPPASGRHFVCPDCAFERGKRANEEEPLSVDMEPLIKAQKETHKLAERYHIDGDYTVTATRRPDKKEADYRGVCVRAAGGNSSVYTAVAVDKGELVTLATYKTAAEAARSYDSVVRHLQQPSAHLNFPTPLEEASRRKVAAAMLPLGLNLDAREALKGGVEKLVIPEGPADRDWCPYCQEDNTVVLCLKCCCCTCHCKHIVKGDVLLCDGCEAEMHIGCTDPPLTSVPDNDWYCPRCAASEAEVKPETPVVVAEEQVENENEETEPAVEEEPVEAQPRKKRKYTVANASLKETSGCNSISNSVANSSHNEGSSGSIRITATMRAAAAAAANNNTSANSVEDDPPPAPEVPVVKKRGRGRPPKSAMPAVPVAPSALKQVLRGQPGRKRKCTTEPIDKYGQGTGGGRWGKHHNLPERSKFSYCLERATELVKQMQDRVLEQDEVKVLEEVADQGDPRSLTTLCKLLEDQRACLLQKIDALESRAKEEKLSREAAKTVKEEPTNELDIEVDVKLDDADVNLDEDGNVEMKVEAVECADKVLLKSEDVEENMQPSVEPPAVCA